MSGRRTKKQLSQSEASKADTKSVKPKSKRRHLAIAVIVGIVALAGIGTALWLSGVVKLGNLGRIIADRTYANWAWGFTSHAYCYGMVSSDDSSRLKELADKIDEYNLVTDGIIGHTVDAGSSCVTTWNYKADNTYDIYCTGDMVGSNPSDEAQEFIQIVNKYLGE